MMAIQRWDPRSDLMELQERMKHLFDEVLTRSGGSAAVGSSGGWQPPLDLFEEAQRYVLRADLPGVAVQDLDIQVEAGKLVLRGERRADPGVAREAYLRVERPHGPFTVQVSIPPSVEPREIRASHRNGVVEVVLPKRRGDAPSRVEISAQ